MGNKDTDDAVRGKRDHSDSVGDDAISPVTNTHHVLAGEGRLEPKDELIPLVAKDEKPLVNAATNVCDDPPEAKADDSGGGDDAEQDGEGDRDDDSHLLQDHGWAWFVCLACFYSHVIVGGFERSDGVLFLEFTDKFKQGAQLTAWPASICSTVRLIMGPVATAMCNRYSARTSVMTGTFIFTAGLIISGFAPNVLFLFFSYGLLQGFGRGLVYAPSLIIVGLYFNRRRGLGVGLGTAGVGFGTFVFPPLVEWLFQQFGFRGAFLVLGGVALNLCIVAALYRPLFVHRNIILGNRSMRRGEEAKALCSQGDPGTAVTAGDQHVEIINDALPDVKTDCPRQRATCGKKKSQRQSTDGHKPKTSRLARCLRSVFGVCFPTEVQRKDGPQRKLIEWSLLKNPSFLFYCLSICLFTAAFKSAFTFLPAAARSQGVAVTDAAYLLSISGILDTIGRIMAGFVLDFECIRPFRPVIYNSVIFVIMAVSFLSPLMRTFVEFAVLFGLYGMLTGIYVSQKSVILVDILGQEKLSSSFGLMICFQGIGTFLGPPLSGLLKDIFGRYDEAFFLGGTAMALAGALMVVSNIYRVLANRRDIRETAQAKD